MSRLSNKIEKALTSKGWKPVRVEFEPISYYSTGREGGWDIEFDTEHEDIPEYAFDGWQTSVYNNGIIADVMEGSIMGYNYKDVLSAIGLMPANTFFRYED